MGPYPTMVGQRYRHRAGLRLWQVPGRAERHLRRCEGNITEACGRAADLRWMLPWPKTGPPWRGSPNWPGRSTRSATGSSAETAAGVIDGDEGGVPGAANAQIGNLVADAMLERVADQGVTIAIHNAGGLRATIDPGDVTMGEVLTVLPFHNTLATFQIEGALLVSALENGVSQVEEGAGRFPQVAGIKFSWDSSAAAGSRVSGVMVMENGAWEPINPEKNYSVVTNNFVRNGGDGYTMFISDSTNAYDFGPGLEHVVADYLAANSPYKPYVDGRIDRK